MSCPPWKADRPARILVVDDSVTYRKIVSDVLGQVAGVQVVGTAANGKIALDLIGLKHPDILTLDLEMPVMDGLELLDQIRKRPDPPAVIMLSAFTSTGAKATLQALSRGAFDFVVKPTESDWENNIATLKHHLLPKIEAYLGASPKPSADARCRRDVSPAPPSGSAGDIARRMDRLGHRPARTDIIVIGVSTGGPQALNQVLPALPANLAVPILIVQHMPPLFTKSLAESLNKHCQLTVCEARDEQRILPGHILIAPGGRQMKVEKIPEGAITRITDDPPENSCRPSVDYLFRSVAYAYGTRAAGIIMTGMGNDGALGCRLLKRQGAVLLAQDEQTCVVYGMPRQPVEEGLVDGVVSLGDLAGEIIRLTCQDALCK
ncbi:MAG: chemotaxis response regulator protein-glutamate methylesterase [Sedimentisphaerales bacterium]|nr:chemotaxis response regulator protein-glutamate methylesterase [Sedimentisphaerales bacterium]